MPKKKLKKSPKAFDVPSPEPAVKRGAATPGKLGDIIGRGRMVGPEGMPDTHSELEVLTFGKGPALTNAAAAKKRKAAKPRKKAPKTPKSSTRR